MGNPIKYFKAEAKNGVGSSITLINVFLRGAAEAPMTATVLGEKYSPVAWLNLSSWRFLHLVWCQRYPVQRGEAERVQLVIINIGLG